ncbi:DUF2628 domain-containing protein [Zavarzinia compransoris]|uniref:DUF2628 domain-containing protein n=1 Tax=Zavarzinia compransoris TaxID=1264899 RepID=A0A317E111_9PROT|nr:DUF2628 domain-containing protein [Zavarzinia compransoris]PWR20639.1 hypothetical protein DKG75_11580 [Zavarzinia compransoris]TDP44544.1 uncharacterized protein DUF2628 [Zavarzinia compransoris]
MRPNAYTVHQGPAGIALVSERFSLFAAVLGPLWLLFRGAFVELAVWVLAVGTAGVVNFHFLADRPLLPVTVLAAQLLIGFEAGDIRRRALVRRGRPVIGVVTGDTLADAEDSVVLRARA